MKGLVGLAALGLLLMSSPAWAVLEDLRPDADVSDTGWDRTSDSSACSGVDCSVEINNEPTTGDTLSVEGTVCSGSGAEADITYRASLTEPTGPNTAWNGTNTQTIRYRASRCASGTSTPTLSGRVWCNGDADGSPQVTGATENMANAEAVFTFTFTSASVTCDPTDIEIGFFCNGSGGSPSGRRSCLVDSIELDGDFTEPPVVRRRRWGN